MSHLRMLYAILDAPSAKSFGWVPVLYEDYGNKSGDAMALRATEGTHPGTFDYDLVEQRERSGDLYKVHMQVPVEANHGVVWVGKSFRETLTELVLKNETLPWPKLPGIQSTGKLDRGTYFLATHEEGTKILTDWCEAAARFVVCRRVPSTEQYPPEVTAVASLMNWTLPDLPCVEAAVWLTTDNPDRHLDWRTRLRRDNGWEPTNRDAVKELWISTVRDIRSLFMG